MLTDSASCDRKIVRAIMNLGLMCNEKVWVSRLWVWKLGKLMHLQSCKQPLASKFSRYDCTRVRWKIETKTGMSALHWCIADFLALFRLSGFSSYEKYSSKNESLTFLYSEYIIIFNTYMCCLFRRRVTSGSEVSHGRASGSDHKVWFYSRTQPGRRKETYDDQIWWRLTLLFFKHRSASSILGVIVQIYPPQYQQLAGLGIYSRPGGHFLRVRVKISACTSSLEYAAVG